MAGLRWGRAGFRSQDSGCRRARGRSLRKGEGANAELWIVSCLLCRSTARRAKEQATHSRFSTRMEKALQALKKRVAGGKLKDPSKIERKVGSLQTRHPRVADLYQVGVTEKGGALAVLGTLVSADIVLPTTDGREIRLRRVTTASAEQKQLLSQLGITIPDRLSFDQECSADSKIG